MEFSSAASNTSNQKKEIPQEKVPNLRGLDVELDYSFAHTFSFEDLAQMPKEEVSGRRPSKKSKDPIKESMDDCLPGRRHSIGGNSPGE